jgi:hypothetical protein
VTARKGRNPRYVGHNWSGWKSVSFAPPPPCKCGHAKAEHVNRECHGAIVCGCSEWKPVDEAEGGK